MCGICGFVRHPDGTDLELSKRIFGDMMLSIERRGRHATGLAVVNKETGITPYVWKSATTASIVLKSRPWKQAMEAIVPGDIIVLGHTRHATQDNASLDEAAHPFEMGEIIGAHNGMIFNWRQIEKELEPEEPFIVDSQAAFALLNTTKPVEALQKLDGYFALEWIKRRQLYLARSTNARLACAYVFSQRTLYWHSEQFELVKLLSDYNLRKDEFKAWEINANTVYRYNPTKFTSTSTHAEKFNGSFSQEKRNNPPRNGTQISLPLSTYSRQPLSIADEQNLLGKVARLTTRVSELERQIDSIFTFLESKGLLDEYDSEDYLLPETCEYCEEEILPSEKTIDGTNGGKVHAFHLDNRQTVS